VRGGAKAPAALVALLLLTGLAGCSEETGPTTDAANNAPANAGEDREPARGGEASIEDFGSEARGADRSAIEGVFRGYLNALAAEDYAVACSYLSGSVQESLERLLPKALKARDCVAILPKLLSPTIAAIAREHANGEIAKIRVEGDRAFVVFRAPGAELYQLTMVGEADEWKASTVTAAVLVPEL
jgi:hypothetical protein